MASRNRLGAITVPSQSVLDRIAHKGYKIQMKTPQGRLVWRDELEPD